MKKKGKGTKPLIVTAAAVVLLVVLMVISAGAKGSSWFESAIGSVFTPIQGFAARSSNAIAGFFGNIFKTTDVDAANARLKSELAHYNQTMIDFEEAKRENERLRALLNYSGTLGDITGVTAQVVGRSTGVWFRVFTVNAGRNKGIDVDMPVISADGLVGVVTEVGATWCKVTAIIDSDMAVPIMVERTRDNCMLRGMLDELSSSKAMELYYLPSDRTDLIPGDTVLTSGVGGVYPKGIRVGSVTEVMTSSGSGVNAIVSPSVDFQHLEEIMVITGSGTEG